MSHEVTSHDQGEIRLLTTNDYWANSQVPHGKAEMWPTVICYYCSAAPRQLIYHLLDHLLQGNLFPSVKTFQTWYCKFITITPLMWLQESMIVVVYYVTWKGTSSLQRKDNSLQVFLLLMFIYTKVFPKFTNSLKLYPTTILRYTVFYDSTTLDGQVQNAVEKKEWYIPMAYPYDFSFGL